jgi:hypothetical protein
VNTIVLSEIQSIIARINEARHMTADVELKEAYGIAEVSLIALEERVIDYQSRTTRFKL